MAFTILVCGSRTFDDGQLVYDVLNGLRGSRLDEELRLIHGGAKGADEAAAAWAKNWGIETDAYFADWHRHGKAAGPIRNQEMLMHGRPELVVAFVDKPLAESKGTAHMVNIARQAGVEVVVVEARP